MATVKRFEDLHVWQKTREFVRLIYSFSNQERFAQDFALKDQIRRAASSIMHNIAEGFGAGSDSEFIRFLGYARRSTTETQSQLYIALDEQYITQSQFDKAYEDSLQILKQINSLIGYLDHSRKQNYKTVKEEQTPYTIELPDQN
jgi:four helix bundle protein